MTFASNLITALVCFMLTSVSEGQVPSESRMDRSRKFVILANLLSAQNEDSGIDLLIDYVASAGKAGEQDLIDWIAAGNRLSPTHARKIFDVLLHSEHDEIISQSLDWLAYDYSSICEDREKDSIKKLLRRKTLHINVKVARVLKAIAE